MTNLRRIDPPGLVAGTLLSEELPLSTMPLLSEEVLLLTSHASCSRSLITNLWCWKGGLGDSSYALLRKRLSSGKVKPCQGSRLRPGKAAAKCRSTCLGYLLILTPDVLVADSWLTRGSPFLSVS